MLRVTITRRPPRSPGSPAARLARLLDALVLAVVAVCRLGLALLIWGPETSRGGDVPYTGCGIYEPVPGKPNVSREMTEVCEGR